MNFYHLLMLLVLDLRSENTCKVHVFLLIFDSLFPTQKSSVMKMANLFILFFIFPGYMFAQALFGNSNEFYSSSFNPPEKGITEK